MADQPGAHCPALSIVIPFLDEREALPLLRERFRQLEGALPEGREIVFVDDGSSDGGTGIIADWARQDPRVRLVVLARNFGHQAALTAGIDFARGEFVGLMDADLQDPPEVLLEMYREARAGQWDVIYAVRQKRQERLARRIAYRLFYRTYALLAETPVDLDSGDFSVLSRRAVQALRSLPEKVRFVRGLRSWIGLRQKGFPTCRPPRAAGVPRYSVAQLVRLAVTGLTSFSTRPLRVATSLGLALWAGALLLGGVYFLLWLTVDLHESVPGFTTLVLLLLFLNGTHFLMMGVLGEYIAHIFLETKQRPPYLVAWTTPGADQEQEPQQPAPSPTEAGAGREHPA